MDRLFSPRNLLGALCALVLLGAASPAPVIDFRNFAGYPAPPCTVDGETPPAFALVDGLHSWTNSGGDAGIDIQYRAKSFGHLRGDASTQAAVLLGCDFPNAMFDQWVDVFDIKGGTAVFVDAVPAGSDNDPTDAITILGNRLIVETGKRTIYALRGHKLINVSK